MAVRARPAGEPAAHRAPTIAAAATRRLARPHARPAAHRAQRRSRRRSATRSDRSLRDHYPRRRRRRRAREPAAARPTATPRTLAFARELRAQHPDDARLHPRRARHGSHDEPFVYTLAPPLVERDPVDVFLFDTRRGFCEHYASAFVVLLRAAGIPARVVTGYQGGEMNPRGGYMIVRQSDAHAWAEALIDGEWQRFDPTAAVSPSRIELRPGRRAAGGEPCRCSRASTSAGQGRAARVGRVQLRLAPARRRLQLRQRSARCGATGSSTSSRRGRRRRGRRRSCSAWVGAASSAGSRGGAGSRSAHACSGTTFAAGSRAPACRAQPYEGPLAYAAARGAGAGRSSRSRSHAIGESFAVLRYGALDRRRRERTTRGAARGTLRARDRRAAGAGERCAALARQRLSDYSSASRSRAAALQARAQLFERLGLDLAHALARDAELARRAPRASPTSQPFNP